MYGKLFASAFTGSLLGKGSDVFAVLAYLVANQDAKGYVEVNPHLLGVAIGCGAEAVERVLAFLESPDPGSRTPDEEGRRIVREGRFLFRLVNGPKYRALRDEDARREYQREWDRKHRPSGHARRLAAVRSGPIRSDAIRPMEKEKKKKRESVGRSRDTRSLASLSEKGAPTVEAWTALARERFPDWPDEDVRSAYTFAASEGKLHARGWEAMLSRLHAAHARRVTASEAKLSPAEREREEIKRAAARTSRKRAER